MGDATATMPEPTGGAEAEPAALHGFLRAGWGVYWTITLALLASASVASATWGLGGLVLPLLCLLICLAAAVTDSAANIIPNALTLPALLLGLLLNCWPALAGLVGAPEAGFLGAVGLGNALLGMVVLGFSGVLCMLLAGMGGGDMKLLAALGAALGLQGAVTAAVLGLIAAVPYALLNLLLRGRLNSFFSWLSLGILETIFTKRIPVDSPPSRTLIPLALPLLAGLLLWRLMPQAWLDRIF